MNFLNSLALVLLSMVGYSAGALIAGRKRKVTPSLPDILVLVTMWGVALLTRGWMSNKWLALCLWVAVGLLMGIVMILFQRKTYPLERKNINMPTNLGSWKYLWEGWKVFGTRLGNYQSRILLGLFYFPVIIPFGIIVRLFQDPLQRKVHQAESRWIPRDKSNFDIETIQRQF
jgi:hypothetical protein